MKPILVMLLVLCAATVFGAVPSVVNYQGFLTAPSGTPLDTVVSITFKLYDTESGGTQLWTETQPSCTVRAGLFNVLLGSVTAIPDSFGETSRWLGLTVGSNSEMVPRTKCASVPYAYRVGTVDGASGGTISGKLNVGSGNLNPGTMALVAGQNNRARGDYSVVAGGGSGMAQDSNSAAGQASFVGGGYHNTVTGYGAAICGGAYNVASGGMVAIGGGAGNVASAVSI